MPDQKRFVAIDSLGTKRTGKKLYFQRWTGIGPMFTSDPREAETFPSEESAKWAASHPMVFIDVEPAPVEALQEIQG